MRIGIILTGDYGWAGGVYYSLNIIKLLSRISSEKQLTVVAIVNAATPPEVLADLPKEHVEISYLDHKSFLYRLYYKLVGNRFVADINALKLDVLYPLIAWEPAHAKLNCKVLYWLYDFQHKFLPALFSEAEIAKRDVTFQQIADKARYIVLSSEDARTHFYRFYPHSQAQVSVYKFISLIRKAPADERPPQNVPSGYFIVCNQFWPHKNHMVVLKAMALLKSQGEPVHIVFTGKYDDQRNKVYVDELQTFITEHALQPYVTLTGFISRGEQTLLMQHAKAVIQPSFFEGWSTVIEDAKALNKFLIVSDIPINREQVSESVLFFAPTEDSGLAEHLSDLRKKDMMKSIVDYDSNIRISQKDLLKLMLN